MVYLNKFGIGNFRAFKNYTEFDLAPITVLTGKNNSGKSSLIKALLLMQANNESDKETPPKFYNHIVFNNLGVKSKDVEYTHKIQRLNLGLVESILNYDSNNDELIISFTNTSLAMYINVLVKLTYKLVGNVMQIININLIDQIKKISFFEYVVDYNENNLKTTYVYNIEYFVKKFEEDYDAGNLHYDFFKRNYDSIISGIKNQEKLKIIDKGKSEFKKKWLQLEEFAKENEKESFFNLKLLGIKEKLSENEYDKLEEYFGKNILNKLSKKYKYDIYDTKGTKLFNNIEYLPQARGIQSRVHSIFNNEIMSKIIDEIIKNDESIKKDNEFRDFFQNQIKRFNIGKEIKIKNIEGVSNVISVITETGREVNLSDLGFGYSQVLPIIWKIILLAIDNSNKKLIDDIPTMEFYESILLLEEPEANLHPDFQSKLADMFVEANNNFDIQFVIETHSEYLIRKLQYLTAKKVINTEDSVIYYFNNPNNIPKGEAQVKRITIDEYGGLSDTFGQGFYDESTRLQFDLLKLNKEQSN